MAHGVLFLSTLLLLVAVVESLRLVRRTGLGRPWLLLSAALVLMALRRVTALVGPRPPDLRQELIALVIAGLVVAAVRSLGGVIDAIRNEELARRSAEQAFHTLLTNIPAVASVIEPDGRWRVLNPSRLAALRGHEPQEAEQSQSWPFEGPAEGRAALEAAVARAREGEVVHLEAPFSHADGSTRWAGTLLYARIERGRITGVNALTSDITERKSLEGQLLHAQKMEALGTMAGGIAHDLNNLLGNILGNVDMASRRLDPDHPSRRFLEQAGRAVTRAGEHTRQFLSFSRRSAINPRRLVVGDVVREAASLVRSTIDPRIELTLRVADDLWAVNGEATELVQLLVNLLLNARDALPRGGRVMVEATNALLDATYARVHTEGRAGEFVRLAVVDDGVGMPPDLQSRIFEPFFTTKAAGHGTGLGLALAYATAKHHGGWIHCYSEPGRGTRFSIYLPRATSDATAAASTTSPEEPIPHGTETLLVVDDDEDLRSVAVESLQELGYTTLAARDGVEALEIFSCERERIRLVLLDLSMPRLDGRDTLTRLHEMEPALPVLIASGHSHEHEGQNLLEQGAVAFVEKPYRLAQIGAAVRHALDCSRAPA